MITIKLHRSREKPDDDVSEFSVFADETGLSLRLYKREQRDDAVNRKDLRLVPLAIYPWRFVHDVQGLLRLEHRQERSGGLLPIDPNRGVLTAGVYGLMDVFDGKAIFLAFTLMQKETYTQEFFNFPIYTMRAHLSVWLHVFSMIESYFKGQGVPEELFVGDTVIDLYPPSKSTYRRLDNSQKK